MAYKNAQCNDSKCQESPPYWVCDCGALNCIHATDSCARCNSIRLFHQTFERLGMTFWVNHKRVSNWKNKRVSKNFRRLVKSL